MTGHLPPRLEQAGTSRTMSSKGNMASVDIVDLAGRDRQREREGERNKKESDDEWAEKRPGCQGFKGNFTFVRLKRLSAQLFRSGATCPRVTGDEKGRRPFPFIFKKKKKKSQHQV